MNTKLLTSSFVAGMVFALALPALALAQAPASTATSAQGVPQKAVTIATVNIYNAAIISQKENVIGIGFDISNREGAQPQIIYTVNLLKKESNGQYSLADKFIYTDDVLSLGAGQTIHKNLEYHAPAFLQGTYQIGLEVRNADGFPFALTQINKNVDLNGSGEYIEINSNNCFLTVEGESADKIYTLQQGVDIAATENLIAHCSIKNGFKTTVSVTSSFQTRYRTAFGKIMGDEKGTSVTLTPGETLAYAVTIPTKNLAPQSYEAVLSLLSDAGALVSEPVYFHYVLRGASATIQNISLDKDRYAKGDTAVLSVYWTGSADAFPGARGAATLAGEKTLSVTISGDGGISCASPLTKKLSTASVVTKIDIPVTANCINPTISAAITDQNGKVIAQNAYAIQSKSVPVQGNALPIAAVLVGAIVLLALIAYAIRRRKPSRMAPLLFFIFVITGLLVGGQTVKADTYSWWYGDCTFLTEPTTVTLDSDTGQRIGITDGNGVFWIFGGSPNIVPDTDIYGNLLSNKWKACTSGPIPLSVTVNLDKPSYNPADTITASATGWIGGCSNLSAQTTLSATINGQTKVLSTGGQDIGGTNYFTAESAPGSYIAAFVYSVTHVFYVDYPFTIPYTVTAAAGTVSASPNPCTIASGASTCSTSISWTTTNVVGAWVMETTGVDAQGVPISGLVGCDATQYCSANLPSPVTVPWISFGQNYTFVLYDHLYNVYDSVVVTGICAAGTSWNGSKCAPAQPPPVSTVVGACSSPQVHYVCATGTSINNSDADSTKWTWSCAGTSNTASCSETKPAGANATVVINIAPSLDFYIDPKPPGKTNKNVLSGSSENLDWSSTNATSCTATCSGSCTGWPAGPATVSLSYPSPGWPTGPLTLATTYTMTCTGPGGSTGPHSVTIGVSGNAACSLPWGGTIPSTPAAGSSVAAYQTSSVVAPASCVSQTRTCTNGVLSGSYTNQSCSVTCGNGANNPAACNQCPNGLAYISSSCVACGGTGCSGTGGNAATPLGSLVCNNGANNPIACSTCTAPATMVGGLCTAPANPIASLYPDLLTIDINTATTLHWTSNTSSCAFVGTPANGISTGGLPNGSVSTGNLASNQTYQIRCPSSGSPYGTAATNVIVQTPAVSITANPTTVTYNGTSTVTWSANGVTSCDVTNPSGTKIASGNANNSHNFSKSSPYTTPPVTASGIYTITCKTNGGADVSAQAAVNLTTVFQTF